MVFWFLFPDFLPHIFPQHLIGFSQHPTARLHPQPPILGSKFLTHLTLPLLPYYPTSIAPRQIYHVFNVLSPVLHLNILPGISPQPPALHPNIFPSASPSTPRSNIFPQHFIWHPSSSIFLKRPAAIRHFFQCLHLPPLPQQIRRFPLFPNTLPRILPLRSPPSLPAFPQRLAASLRALQLFALFRLRHTPLLFTSSSPPPILHSKIAHISNTPPLVLHPNILPPLTSPALPSHCSAATSCLRYSVPKPLTPLSHATSSTPPEYFSQRFTFNTSLQYFPLALHLASLVPHFSSPIFLKRPAAVQCFFQCLHLPPLPQQIRRFPLFPNTLLHKCFYLFSS